jgi:hypothetical protein
VSESQVGTLGRCVQGGGYATVESVEFSEFEEPEVWLETRNERPRAAEPPRPHIVGVPLSFDEPPRKFDIWRSKPISVIPIDPEPPRPSWRLDDHLELLSPTTRDLTSRARDAADGELMPETKPVIEVSKPDVPSRIDQFVASALESAVGKAAELAVEAIAPGCGVLVKVAYIVAEVIDAVTSISAGKGFTFALPMVDGPAFNLEATVRLTEHDPAPLPQLGVKTGFNSSLPSAVEYASVDDVSEQPTVVVYRNGPWTPPLAVNTPPRGDDPLKILHLVPGPEHDIGVGEPVGAGQRFWYTAFRRCSACGTPAGSPSMPLECDCCRRTAAGPASEM